MRGKKAPKRKITKDAKYENEMIGKFINLLMQQGKKSIAQSIIYKSFSIIQHKTGKEPLEVFEQAIRNVSPVLEVKSRRVGGANYQVPVEVKGDRRLTLAMRWIINAARSRKGKPMSDKLALEFIDASQNLGEAIKKKEDVHRMAESNRAFAHFA